jgi:hypothetical protein
MGEKEDKDLRPPGKSARREREEDLRAFGPAVREFLKREREKKEKNPPPSSKP